MMANRAKLIYVWWYILCDCFTSFATTLSICMFFYEFVNQILLPIWSSCNFRLHDQFYNNWLITLCCVAYNTWIYMLQNFVICELCTLFSTETWIRSQGQGAVAVAAVRQNWYRGSRANFIMKFVWRSRKSAKCNNFVARSLWAA